MENIIQWAIAALFMMVGILFLSGHGWQLIAGYNTASKEKKGKYNLARLYLVDGIGMFLLGLLMAFMNYFIDDWSLFCHIVFLMLFLLIIIVLVILNGTWCMKSNQEDR